MKSNNNNNNNNAQFVATAAAATFAICLAGLHHYYAIVSSPSSSKQQQRDKDDDDDEKKTKKNSDSNTTTDKTSTSTTTKEIKLPSHLERELHKERQRRAKIPFISRKSPMYDNIQMLDPRGNVLFSISRKKARWYIQRQLAHWVVQEEEDSKQEQDDDDEIPTRIQLDFEPRNQTSNNNNTTSDDNSSSLMRLYLTSRKQNHCVACGGNGTTTTDSTSTTRQHLIRHYIVPHAYRTLLPNEYKSHLSHDVVVLCPDCHFKATSHYQERMQHLDETLRPRIVIPAMSHDGTNQQDDENESENGFHNNMANNNTNILVDTRSPVRRRSPAQAKIRSAALALLRWKQQLPPETRSDYQYLLSRHWKQRNGRRRGEEVGTLPALAAGQSTGENGINATNNNDDDHDNDNDNHCRNRRRRRRRESSFVHQHRHSMTSDLLLHSSSPTIMTTPRSNDSYYYRRHSSVTPSPKSSSTKNNGKDDNYPTKQQQTNEEDSTTTTTTMTTSLTTLTSQEMSATGGGTVHTIDDSGSETNNDENKDDNQEDEDIQNDDDDEDQDDDDDDDELIELTPTMLQTIIRQESHQEPNPHYISHARLVISSLENNHDKISNFILEWRRFFVELLEPKYLPKGWSVDSPVTCSPHKTTTTSAA